MASENDRALRNQNELLEKRNELLRKQNQQLEMIAESLEDVVKQTALVNPQLELYTDGRGRRRQQ